LPSSLSKEERGGKKKRHNGKRKGSFPTPPCFDFEGKKRGGRKQVQPQGKGEVGEEGGEGSLQPQQTAGPRGRKRRGGGNPC